MIRNIPSVGKTVFEDGDMFKVIVPLTAREAEVTGEVTPQVTPQVVLVLDAAVNFASGAELQQAAGLKDRVHFLKAYLEPLLADGLIERTIPEKPTSRLQKYRLTDKGQAVLRQAR